MAMLVSNTSQSEAARRSGVNRTAIVKASVVLKDLLDLRDELLPWARLLDVGLREGQGVQRGNLKVGTPAPA
jgi:hypothetical protein